MLLEKQLEEDLVREFSKLGLQDCQIIASRGKDKTERDDVKTVVAVAVATRSHDSFSLSPVTINCSVSFATRVELDKDSDTHCDNVEKVVNLLSLWHFRGEMVEILDSPKLRVGELRLTGGTGTLYDYQSKVYTDTLTFEIRGAEIFPPPDLTNAD